MEKNEYYERIPHVEDQFFTTNEEAHIVLEALIDYHGHVENRFPDKLKDLVYIKAKEAIVPVDEDREFVHHFLRYCRNLLSAGEDEDRVNKYLDLFAGKSARLVQWSFWSHERLPQHLEDTISDPSELLAYAVDVVKGRVPEHLESVFHNDIHYAVRYAFDVIRGFAPVKLPDHLHNAVVLESFKDPDDYDIKNYMKASESDPNKTGNYSDN